jgi:hypothetical protein
MINYFKFLRSIYPTDAQVFRNMNMSSYKFEYYLQSYVRWKQNDIRKKKLFGNQVDEEIFKSSVLKYEGLKNNFRKSSSKRIKERDHPLWFYVDTINRFDNLETK